MELQLNLPGTNTTRAEREEQSLPVRLSTPGSGVRGEERGWSSSKAADPSSRGSGVSGKERDRSSGKAADPSSRGSGETVVFCKYRGLHKACNKHC